MYEYKCKVLKVIDGDTVDCEIDLGFNIKMIKRVRLLGVNTSELNSKIEEERNKARAAKEYVENIKSSVTRIKTELDKSDSFGRVLGKLYIEDDVSINDLLLAEGLAIPYMR